MPNLIARELLAKHTAKIPMPAGLNLRDHLRQVGSQPNGHKIYEFVGADSFSAEWNTRQRFEVDAGRDEEPLLYMPLYEEIRDASLPELIPIYKIGPGGVVFEEVFDGGEVKFGTIGSSTESVKMHHWATGLEYSKDLVMYNRLWEVSIFERQMGIAHNALLNHLHLYPIISYAYTSANQTGATNVADSIVEEYLFTLEAAITASETDTTNPRRGPYSLLISAGQRFIVEKMLQRVAQQGFSVQSSAIGMINNVIVYDGWTGTRGAKTTTYPGVTSGKAYLISQQYKGQDFQSYVKQDLQNEGMQEDVSRFLTSSVWDSYEGVYANPLRSTEEITWPTS